MMLLLPLACCRASNSAHKSAFRPFKLTMQRDGNLVGKTQWMGRLGFARDMHTEYAYVGTAMMSISSWVQQPHPTGLCSICWHVCVF